MDAFEEFHVAAKEDLSQRTAALLRAAQVRLRQTIRVEARCSWYVIEVHSEDLARAYEIFAADVGPGRTFASGADC
jgi:hypothetical protein